MACEEAFIDCTTLSISYNIMGIATVSYTMIHRDPTFCYTTVIEAGGQIFSGYVADMTLNQIPGTVGWYSTAVTLITTTN